MFTLGQCPEFLSSFKTLSLSPDQILDGVNPDEDKKKDPEEKPKSRDEVIDETVAQCKLTYLSIYMCAVVVAQW